MDRFEIGELVAGYDGPAIVKGVSLSVEAGRIAALLGPNGAGKSTLAKATVGLLPIQSGRVSVGGSDVTGRPPHALARVGVGYMPQLRSIFDELSVLENLEMGAYSSPGDVRPKIREILELFPDLQAARKKGAGELSGGQQRMLALARTLMMSPKFVVLDEPSAGLSPLYAERVWSQVARVRDSGVGILVVEQNVNVALAHADYAFVLVDGQLAIHGTPAELAENQQFAMLMVG